MKISLDGNKISITEIIQMTCRRKIKISGIVIVEVVLSETEFDEETSQLAIAELFERKLLKLTETRRLEVTQEVANLSEGLKIMFFDFPFYPQN